MTVLTLVQDPTRGPSSGARLGNSRLHARTGTGVGLPRMADRPDLAVTARGQVAAARATLGQTCEEFAATLAPLLGWAPSPHTVDAWERIAVPPGDVLLAAGLAAQGAGR
ncbi:hypothetical protein OHA72_21955 [Dactylosporangium sp. NBC_01737]|uniref:hypothetical protein n=1 Tax=Dactylosporangium sp. NBC_01737 TaxID=2975959 RepID=UPI002E164F5C|nr:hypothetical protein OHA72_21955 [Dactylosporangium sp. NBC_01737]